MNTGESKQIGLLDTHWYEVSKFMFQSPVYTRTPTMYLDFKMDSGSVMEQAIPKGWTAFIYTLTGAGEFGWFHLIAK